MDPSEAETTSQHKESDNEQMPKVKGTKTHLNALERSSKQIVDAWHTKAKDVKGLTTC